MSHQMEDRELLELAAEAYNATNSCWHDDQTGFYRNGFMSNWNDGFGVLPEPTFERGNEMSKSCARPVTPDEFEQGYAVCDCGKFAHVFRASALAKLPKGYNGELCKECSCMMVAVEMLTPNA